jgi:hypothetical protein
MARNALKTLTEICHEMVRDMLILHPTEPATLLAAQLADELDTEVERDLSRHLLAAFFLRLIRAERTSERERAKRPRKRRMGFRDVEISAASNKGGWGAVHSDERWEAYVLASNARWKARIDAILGLV